MESLKAPSPDGCHACIYEWADACDNKGEHLPSGKIPCLSCCRNPQPPILPALDHYVHVTEAIDDLIKKYRGLPC